MAALALFLETRLMLPRSPGLLLVASLLGLRALVLQAEDSPRPNIVFILADDLGYTDLHCYGSGYYETPRIDRMAAEGLRFTDGYTCGPNCQPTRAALMSGQYMPRTGIYTVGSIDRFDWSRRPLRPVDNVEKLPLEKVTIAQALRKAGYRTGIFGKWHLGSDRAHHPAQRGFEEAVVSAGQHFDFETSPKIEVPQGAYLADWLTDRALDFILRHRDEPFFLYLPHFGVHAPHQAKGGITARFKGRSPSGGHRDPTYASMIYSVDESVGRILDLLEELGLSTRTLVVFSSDNGGVGGYESAGLPNKGITDNAPLKSGKGSLYEGGIRVPYIFRWPGVIRPRAASAVPITSVDLYPTLLEVAGAAAEPGYALDGASYLDVLRGGSQLRPRSPLFWHFPGYLGLGRDQWRTTPVSVIREGSWKLLQFLEDGRLELYDLSRDIGERKNLLAEDAEGPKDVDRPTDADRAKTLLAKLEAWRKVVHAPMPTRRQPGESGAEPANPGARKSRKSRKNGN